MSILNLTQHAATAEQIAAGVVDLPADKRKILQALLTFKELPYERDIYVRASTIADLAAFAKVKTAMIGGALWLMAPLAAALLEQRIEPVFAFSVRSTEEQIQPDGSVRKASVFRHVGFVPALNAAICREYE